MENNVNKNMKVCKVCGKEIAKAPKCIHCGADQRNFWRHKILTGILVILVFIIIGQGYRF